MQQPPPGPVRPPMSGHGVPQNANQASAFPGGSMPPGAVPGQNYAPHGQRPFAPQPGQAMHPTGTGNYPPGQGAPPNNYSQPAPGSAQRPPAPSMAQAPRPQGPFGQTPGAAPIPQANAQPYASAQHGHGSMTGHAAQAQASPPQQAFQGRPPQMAPHGPAGNAAAQPPYQAGPSAYGASAAPAARQSFLAAGNPAGPSSQSMPNSGFPNVPGGNAPRTSVSGQGAPVANAPTVSAFAMQQQGQQQAQAFNSGVPGDRQMRTPSGHAGMPGMPAPGSSGTMYNQGSHGPLQNAPAPPMPPQASVSHAMPPVPGQPAPQQYSARPPMMPPVPGQTPATSGHNSSATSPPQPQHGTQSSYQTMPPIPGMPQAGVQHSNLQTPGATPQHYGGGGFPPAPGPVPFPQGQLPQQQYAQSASNMPPIPGQQAQYQPINSPPTQPVAAEHPQKLTAALMPNMISVLKAEAARFAEDDSYYRSSTCVDIMPPVPAIMSDVPIVDDGNCSARIMRPTCYQLPVTEEMATASRIPIGLVVQPFARQHPREQPIPRVDMGASPVRCSRCRAFVSMFCRFTRGGRAYDCAICGMTNEVPEHYFCSVDASGNRADITQRPELTRATVDIIAPRDYSLRPPSRPYLLFALDASRAALQTGALTAACAAARECLREIASRRAAIEERMTSGDPAWAADSFGLATYERVAIVLYDKIITVCDLRTEDAALLVMGDVKEPFLPMGSNPSAMFVDGAVAFTRAERLLERIPALMAERAPTESCIGSVASFAVQALEKTGGRAMIFLSSLPTTGLAPLKPREESKSQSAEKADPYIVPHGGEFYAKTAQSAAEKGVSFVLAATPIASNQIDLANVGQLARMTSGSILYHPRFSLDAPGARDALISDVCAALLRPFGFDCVLRLRAGSGMQTGEYWGNMTSLNQTDYLFASLDCNQSFGVTLMYDSKLSENERVVFQLAALYTCPVDGSRIIRVANLALPATSSMANVYRMTDVDAYACYTAKRAVHQAISGSSALSGIASGGHHRTAQILAAYRKHCASTMPNNQLVLPETLKLLPLQTLALSKSAAFGPNNHGPDARVCALAQLCAASMSNYGTLVYPRLFAVYPVPADAGNRVTPSSLFSDSAFVQLRLKRESLQPNGVYLLENSRRAMLWLGPQVEPSVADALFGVPAVQSLTPSAYGSTSALPRRDNPLSKRLATLVDGVVLARYPDVKVMALTVVRSGTDPMELEWQSLLIEDGHASVGPSYVDFVCRLHHMVLNEMTTSSLAEKAALLSFLH